MDTNETIATLAFQLAERRKELECHNAITALMDEPGLEPEDVYQGVCDAVLPAFLFPERTSVTIRVGDDSFHAGTDTGGRAEVSRSASLSDGQRLTVTVRCNPPLPLTETVAHFVVPDTPFLPEEHALLDGVVGRLAAYAREHRDTAALRERTALLDSILSAAPDAILIVGEDGTIISASDSTATLLGVSDVTLLIGSSAFGHLRPEDIPRARRHLDDLIGLVRSPPVELTLVRRDGSLAVAEVAGRPIAAGGSHRRFLLIIRDVTTQRDADRRIAAAEHLYRGLVTAVRDVFFEATQEGTISYCSPAIEGISGRSAAAVEGTALVDLVDADDAPQLREALADVFSDPIVEVRARTTDGEARWCRIALLPIRDNGVVVGVRGTISDIDEQKRALFALEERETALQSLLNSQTNYVIRTDLDGYHTYSNATFDRVFGWAYPDAEARAYGLDSICDYHHQRTRDAVEQCVAVPGRVVRVELDKPAGDGGTRTTLWEFVCLTSAAGVPTEIQCVGIDVTEQVEARRALAASEENYRNLFENAPDGYLIIEDGVFVDCNRAAERMIGGGREAILGRRPVDISADVQPNGMTTDYAVETYLGRVARDGRSRFEWLHRRVDGSTLLTDVQLSVVQHDGTERILATWRDLSMERSALLKAAESEDRLNQASLHNRTVVWECDTDGLLTYVSPAATVVYGRTPEELVGTCHFWEMTIPALRERDRDNGLAIIAAGEEVVSFDKPILHADGRTLWVAANGRPLRDAAGTIIGFRGSDAEITARKEAEEGLQTFRTITDEAMYGIAIARTDGVLTYTNEAYARMHGRTVDEMVGAPIAIGHTPEQLDHVSATLETLMREGGFVAEEVWHTRKDGTTFPTLMSAVLIRDGDAVRLMAATAIDITEMKERELEITKLRLAIEQSPVALMVTDLEARIEYVSPAFTQITGYTFDEVVGRPTSVLSAGRTPRAVYADLWSTIRAGHTWTGEWLNRKKSGEEYPERVTITPVFGDDGAALSYLAIKEDVTALRRAEDERVAREAAEQANAAKSQFLSNMSHEIRTPLNAILGFTQILAGDDALSDRHRRHLGTIRQSSEHLLALINDILDLSRIETGRFGLDLGDFAVASFVSEIESMMHGIAQEKGLSLTFRVGTGVPPAIRSDERKLRQVVINLIGNAIKFTERGGITVSIDSDGAWLHLGVADTGHGIAPDDVDRIFAAFGQADAGRRAGGTGLGLTISRRIAELLGGDLSVASTPGVGTTFRMTVPLEAAHDEVLPDRTGREGEVAAVHWDGAPPRVLVVDDVAANRMLLREILEPLGFRVDEAADGEEAIARFERWAPDAILMDLRMPRLDGQEAVRRIRGMEAEAGMGRTFIAAVTASAFDSDRERVMSAGFDAYVRKPFHASHVVTMVAEGLHLPYDRDAPTPSASTRARDAQLDFAAIPDSLRGRLIAAVSEGDRRAMATLIEETRTFDAAMADEIDRRVRAYDYELLLERLQGGDS